MLTVTQHTFELVLEALSEINEAGYEIYSQRSSWEEREEWEDALAQLAYLQDIFERIAYSLA